MCVTDLYLKIIILPFLLQSKYILCHSWIITLDLCTVRAHTGKGSSIVSLLSPVSFFHSLLHCSCVFRALTTFQVPHYFQLYS